MNDSLLDYLPSTRLSMMKADVQRSICYLDQSWLPVLRPLISAYALGYASSTVPRLLNLLVTRLVRRQNKASAESVHGILLSTLHILRGGLEWQRFPTFCAALVGGSTILQIPLRKAFALLAKNLNKRSRTRLIRWISAFIAAWFSIKILQFSEKPGVGDTITKDHCNTLIVSTESTIIAGRTLDLTVFSLTRAIDILIGELWSSRKERRVAGAHWTRADALISSVADPGIFAISSALIMWSFIYLPDRLPKTYNRWIARAADVDERLLLVLRRCRRGQLIYGTDTGQAHLLESMCNDHGWPGVWADPAKTIPIPCEMVHMGTGTSCEWHAIRRLLKSFGMALGMYGPLNLILQVRNPSRLGFLRALYSSIRSSAFLASFIALYYYGVCLARTRIGPQILGSDNKSRQILDSGVCIGSGCALCGWSILLENTSRRKDIALFVAPRALATLLPRKYDVKYRWRENLTFAFSTAVVFTCVQENPARVRGVIGKILRRVLVP